MLQFLSALMRRAETDEEILVHERFETMGAKLSQLMTHRSDRPRINLFRSSSLMVSLSRGFVSQKSESLLLTTSRRM